jgi:hypothetical protein
VEWAVGFVVMAQVGGRILDKRGARPTAVMGSALAAVGFYLLAGKLTDLSLHAQVIYIILAGGGMGLMLGAVSTDAVNRAPSTSYSEVTGITQTARNFGASLGLAVLGVILLDRNKTNVTQALIHNGVPSKVAHKIAEAVATATSGSQSTKGATPALLRAVHAATAQSTPTVFYVMAGVMAASFVVSVIWFPRGRVEAPVEQTV